MSAAILDGPRVSARGGQADALVVLLHGYGADGNDLIDLARVWSPMMPRVAFVAPHAPEPCAQSPGGRQWFPLTAIEPAALRAGVRSAAPALDGFLDRELASLGLSGDRLVLAGFSQGTMMALSVGPRREALGGIVGYSGLIADGGDLEAEARQRPPILLVHGDSDPVIPPTALFAAVGALGEAGFAAEWHLQPGLGHGIDQAGLDLGEAFIKRILGEPS